MAEPLSLHLEALRTWWAQYAEAGMELTPEVIANMTRCLDGLKSQAERYEDQIADGRTLAIAVQAETLRTRAARFGAIDAALAAKGLELLVLPASALLSDEHLADGKVALFPRSWRVNRRHSAGPS